MPKFTQIVLFFFVLMSMVLGLFFGASDISWREALSCLTQSCSNDIQQTIFWQIRLPRVLLGFLVGAGLAVAGATLQNTYRNSLADPYLFGVVSGAGLGASIATLLSANADTVGTLASNVFNHLPFSVTLPAFAFAGAILAVFIVQLLCSRLFGDRTEHLLLAGVAVSFMLGALTHFLLFMAEPFAANKVIFWLLGSLAQAQLAYVWIMLPVISVSVVILWLLGRHLDALLLGDDAAFTLGVNVKQLRVIILMVCAALTASIVAYCGGIGFVGLMIPHIVRRWFGVTTRSLIIGCVLVGGSFLIWVDVLARMLVADQEIPIGIITSAIGSVFFLFALKQNRGV